jgi:hypothetical protein
MSRRLLDAKLLISATSEVPTCGGLWLCIPTCRPVTTSRPPRIQTLLLEFLLYFHPCLLRKQYEALTGGVLRPIRMEGYALSRYPTVHADGTRKRCCVVSACRPLLCRVPELARGARDEHDDTDAGAVVHHPAELCRVRGLSSAAILQSWAFLASRTLLLHM